jgi:hypothetical protein
MLSVSSKYSLNAKHKDPIASHGDASFIATMNDGQCASELAICKMGTVTK